MGLLFIKIKRRKKQARTNSNYRHYKFIGYPPTKPGCGHEQDLKTGHVRKRSFKCAVCPENEIVKQAASIGLKVLGDAENTHPKPTDYRSCQFKGCPHKRDISVSSIKKTFENKGKRKCSICHEGDFINEALEKGLKLISDMLPGGFRKYKPIDCDHYVEMQPADVRDILEKYQCKGCEEGGFKKEAIEKGLKLVKKLDDGSRQYKVTKCGHTTELKPISVRRITKKYTCPKCAKQEQKKLAKKRKLKYLRKVKGRNGFHLWEFKNCGHKQEIAVSSVKKKTFHCSIYHQMKLGREAELIGLILLGGPEDKTKDFNYKSYLCEKCKHKNDFTISNVRIGNVSCFNCGETPWAKHSNLYLIKISFPGTESLKSKIWLKLGHSEKIDQRIKTYGLPPEVTDELIGIIGFDTRREAASKENAIRKKYAKDLLPSEEMKKYHSKVGGGKTECFPASLETKLIEEFSSQNDA
jgi:hypothetical protein